MTAHVIIIGINEWERFTRPCIDSIIDTNISFSILCVDNGSAPPYEKHRPCFDMIHAKQKQSYSAGINFGLASSKPHDWYIITNNDVLFHEPIYDKLHQLRDDCLYGFMLYKDIFKLPYLSGWCYFVSQYVLDKVGLFDERFQPMWFEDADYSFRCIKNGINLVELDRVEWGIEHLERKGERAPLINNHIKEREANRKYLRRKHGLL